MFEDRYIRQQVRIENLKAGEAQKIAILLDDIHQDLILRLEKTSAPWSRQRLIGMISTYEDALEQVFSGKIIPKLKDDAIQFVEKNMAFHVETLKIGAQGSTSATVTAAAVSANLSASAVATAALAEPMQGKLLVQWADELKRKDRRMISDTLKMAWMEGRTVRESAEDVLPIMRATKNDARAVVRTFYSHLSSESRKSVFQENKDILETILWDSTLDSRTTIEICAPRDRKEYTLAGEPVGHNLDFHGGPGQAHFNCRSSAIPVIKGIPMKIRRRALSPGSKYERGDNTTRTGKVRKNTADARKKGIYKQETVGPKTNYESWLRRQPKDFQQDVLGVKRAEAFRKGEWSLGDKFQATNPTTLENF